MSDIKPDCFKWINLKLTFSLFSGFAYGGLDFSRRDLMAINIQRGRDHGLSDYNTARRHYGLQQKSDFLDIKANESNIPDKVCAAMLIKWMVL
jgi:hypothetical protein